jgi:hypothetical protein
VASLRGAACSATGPLCPWNVRTVRVSVIVGALPGGCFAFGLGGGPLAPPVGGAETQYDADHESEALARPRYATRLLVPLGRMRDE